MVIVWTHRLCDVITIIPDENIPMNIFKILLVLKEGKKFHYIWIDVWKDIPHDFLGYWK